MNDTIITALQIERMSYKTNHILHLLLSIVTAGFWIPIWILAYINNGMKVGCVDGKIGHVQKGGQIDMTKKCFRLW